MKQWLGTESVQVAHPRVTSFLLHVSKVNRVQKTPPHVWGTSATAAAVGAVRISWLAS